MVNGEWQQPRKQPKRHVEYILTGIYRIDRIIQKKGEWEK
jgi:hypothetical protein